MKVLLDEVDQLFLPMEQADAYGNELNALRALAGGLVFLSRQIAEAEERVAQQGGWEPGQVVMLLGRHPAFAGVSQELLSSFYLWYPTSLCNYVRLTGWIAHEGNAEATTEYLRRVVPEHVLAYRNKVAAHFALLDPRSDDTAADLQASVMLPVLFLNGRLVARGFRVAVAQGSEQSKSVDLMWSITEVHEVLAQRYRWAYPPSGNKPPLPPVDPRSA